MDRQLEKRFKEWLVKSHKELDRTIKFEALCNQAVQVWQDATGIHPVHGCVTMHAQTCVAASIALAQPYLTGQPLCGSV